MFSQSPLWVGVCAALDASSGPWPGLCSGGRGGGRPLAHPLLSALGVLCHGSEAQVPKPALLKVLES